MAREYGASGVTRAVVMLTHEYPPFPGGMATYAAGMTGALRDAGVQVHVVAPDYPALACDDSGAGISRLFKPHRLTFATLAMVLLRLRRFPKDAFYHAVDIRSALVLWLAKGLYGIRYAVTIHGSEVHKLGGTSLAGRVATRAYRAAETIFANSAATRALFLSRVPGSVPVRVTHLGIDCRWFAAAPERFENPQLAALDGGSTRFVCSVGRLEDRKGHLLALEALGRLPAARRETLLYVVAGPAIDEAYAAQLRAAAARSPIRTLITGALTEGDVRRLFRRSICHVLSAVPLQKKIEGFGFVILEAAAQGCPTIATRVGGIPEVIRADETGILVTDGDVDGLANALETLLADGLLRERLSRAAIPHAKTFTWKACMQTSYGDFARLVAARARPALTVSVIVTCYNLERHIRDAVESVLAQTARGRIAEVIVVDDGSTDNSRAIIAELAAQNPIIKPIFKENGGASSARNAGIALATAPYIAFLDGDDVWLPEKTAHQLRFAEQHPEAGLLVCDFEEVKAAPQRTQTIWVRDFRADDADTLKTQFLLGGPVLPSASLIRRYVFDVCGGFDPAQKYCNDDEMWMRIAHRFSFHRTPGVFVRKHEIANSISSNIEKRLEAMHHISSKVYAMRPDLKRYDGRRRARLELQAALGALVRGNRRAARRSFARGVAANPLSAKMWSYLVLSLLPGNPDAWIDGAKALLAPLRRRAMGRSLFRRADTPQRQIGPLKTGSSA
jgi:glycosyltransferase involved in cell wall biosynthesis